MKRTVLAIAVPLSLILLAGGTSSLWLPPALRWIAEPKTISRPAPSLPHLAVAPIGYHLAYHRYLENSYTEVFEGDAGSVEISVRAENDRPDHCAALAPFLLLSAPRHAFEQNGVQGVVFRREDANHDRLAFTLLYPGRMSCVKIEQRPASLHAPEATSPDFLVSLLRQMVQPVPGST